MCIRDRVFNIPLKTILRFRLQHSGILFVCGRYDPTTSNIDWSYLNRDGRQQLLSKQAKENLHQAKKNCDGWLLITPTEYDKDELMACISSDEPSMECKIAKT